MKSIALTEAFLIELSKNMLKILHQEDQARLLDCDFKHIGGAEEMVYVFVCNKVVMEVMVKVLDHVCGPSTEEDL